MNGAELARRVRVASRDRLWPPRYARQSPAEAYRALFTAPAARALETSSLPGWLRPVGDAAGLEPELHAAKELLAGRWAVFGQAVRLQDPPRWNANPVTGDLWPQRPSRQLDYRRTDVAGGPRYVWELGRLTLLPTLALAWRATGDPVLAALAQRWLDDWNTRQPLGVGVHYTSGLELAIRVHTVCATLALLGEEAARVDLEACLGLLAQQAFHCRDHLSLGSSANNHLLAEYAAMALMGAAFPALRGGDRLAEAGLTGLWEETLRQFHADGVNAEQAWGYLPFIWELVLYASVLAEATGRRAPVDVRGRLRASLEFARTIRLPDGRWPQVGDEDDGRVLLTGERSSRLDLVGNALATWLGEDALTDGESALSRLLFGRVAPSRMAADGVHEYPLGGYTVWRQHGLLVTFDHGPLGLGALAAHGHADALSLTVFRGADRVVMDSGTGAYHEDEAARDRFRGTPYHSTVHFGGRSQSERRGPFQWGRRARIERSADGFVCHWVSGEVHGRDVRVGTTTIDVTDRIRGREAEIVFVLAPEATVTLDGPRAVVTVGGTRATFEASGISGWRAAPGEYSARFGARCATTRLAGSPVGAAVRTTIHLDGR